MPDNAKKRILAVDDDPSVCEFYEKSLKLLGYDIECSPSAAKAREALAKRRPDLILMDIMMPDQDGISFTRDLRGDEKTADIPILVISGLADAATLSDALLFGAAGYLVKPVDLDALKSKMDQAIAHAEKRRKS